MIHWYEYDYEDYDYAADAILYYEEEEELWGAGDSWEDIYADWRSQIEAEERIEAFRDSPEYPAFVQECEWLAFMDYEPGGWYEDGIPLPF